MKIGDTTVIEKPKFYKYLYKTNIIMVNRNKRASFSGDYLPIYFTTTAESNRESGYFKENCKNILIHIKEMGFNGLSIEKYSQLTDVAKTGILVGVDSGWIEEVEALSTYRIREIKE